MKAWFERLANRVTTVSGSPWAFLLAVAVVVLWAATGPLFHYTNTWQLVINTGTTIVTFLMVFLIQSAQNRDTMALNVKLDALIDALDEAPEAAKRAEEETQEQLEAVLDRLRAGKPWSEEDHNGSQ